MSINILGARFAYVPFAVVGMPLTTVSSLLRAGGVFHDVHGETAQDVLRAFVGRLPLRTDADRAALLSALEAREASGSTGIGGGIAIPHGSGPLAFAGEHPFVALALLARPIDFGAPDREPVHALFLIVGASPPQHLAILAQIGALLRDAALRDMLRLCAAAHEILARVELLERT